MVATVIHLATSGPKATGRLFKPIFLWISQQVSNTGLVLHCSPNQLLVQLFHSNTFRAGQKSLNTEHAQEGLQ